DPLLQLQPFSFRLHPMLRTERLSLWPRCWREGSTPALKDRLALTNLVTWSDLDLVAACLREQGVQDGELNCTDWRTVSLYLDLDLRPATRFVFFNNAVDFFPGHREEIRRAILASEARYVVSDLALRTRTVAQAKAIGQQGPLGLPPNF